eukprot:gene19902-10092_t
MTSDVRRRPPVQTNREYNGASASSSSSSSARPSSGSYTGTGKVKTATDFVADYFADVVNSKQVSFREYNYIRATPQNRRAFLILLWDTLRPIGGLSDMLSVADYFSIINLICEDFPFGLVRSAAALVLVDDAVDCLLPFTDFYPAFQLLFFFQEFVAHCRTAYNKCSTATSSTAPPSATVLTADFITNLAAVRKSAQLKEWFLDIEIVKSALVTETIESHDSMLFQLSKSDAVHAAIKTISLKRMKDVQTEIHRAVQRFKADIRSTTRFAFAKADFHRVASSTVVCTCMWFKISPSPSSLNSNCPLFYCKVNLDLHPVSVQRIKA